MNNDKQRVFPHPFHCESAADELEPLVEVVFPLEEPVELPLEVELELVLSL